MEITQAMLTHLSKLSQLTPMEENDPKTQVFKTSLENFFGLLDELKKVDTTDIEPLYHPLDLIMNCSQPLREDWAIPIPSAMREQAQKQASAFAQDLYLVPKVIES